MRIFPNFFLLVQGNRLSQLFLLLYVYFCRKTNGSKRYEDLWRRSVDETSNELDLLSYKERIDRQIEWLKELRDGVVDDDGEHNETQK